MDQKGRRSTIPFSIGIPCEGPLFVGRSEETKRVLDALDNVGHALIVGDRRIGKTSLSRAVAKGLDDKKYLTCYCPWHAFDHGRPGASGVCEVAVEVICESLADRLLHLKPHDLMQAARTSAAGVLKDIQYSRRRRIVELYLDVTSSGSESSGVRSTTAGASMVGKVERQEARSAAVNLPPLSWRHRLEVIRDLASIVAQEGFEGIFVALDEANSFVEAALHEMPVLLDAFAELGVRLCLIGPPWGAFGRLATVLSYPAAVVRVSGFTSPKPVRDMLTACSSALEAVGAQALSWPREVEVVAHAVTRGRPMDLQLLLCGIIERLPEGQHEISLGDVLPVVEDLVPHWQEAEMQEREAAFRWFFERTAS